jgi:hypothetical protein
MIELLLLAVVLTGGHVTTPEVNAGRKSLYCQG